jgi:hypothetical protein
MKTRLDITESKSAKPKTLNAQQTGRAAELRFCSLVMLGSGGLIELVPPAADDERRDFELHPKHRFGQPLSIQVKVATQLDRGDTLRIRVLYGRRQPVDRAYWFFLAYLDLKTLDFADPMFLIPSTALRRRGRPVEHVRASIRAGAGDRWVKYRVTRLDLGRRLCEELHRLHPAGEEVAA